MRMLQCPDSSTHSHTRTLMNQWMVRARRRCRNWRTDESSTSFQKIQNYLKRSSAPPTPWLHHTSTPLDFHPVLTLSTRITDPRSQPCIVSANSAWNWRSWIRCLAVTICARNSVSCVSSPTWNEHRDTINKLIVLQFIQNCPQKEKLMKLFQGKYVCFVLMYGCNEMRARTEQTPELKTWRHTVCRQKSSDGDDGLVLNDRSVRGDNAFEDLKLAEWKGYFRNFDWCFVIWKPEMDAYMS